MPTPLPHTDAQLVTLDGRTLPLRATTLRADAQGGLCRVILVQHFVNPHAEPLHVTYRMPLPADGAVSGYAFVIGDRRVVGEVDKKAAARERFEQALVEGRTAGLVEEERSSLFTQELGNVPPGAELIAELTVDQKLAYLPEGLWEWRFPTAAAPRYLGAAVTEPSQVELTVADRKVPIHVGLELSVRDAFLEGATLESPSHRLHSARSVGRTEVTFAEEGGAALDRDVVVRWSARAHDVRAHLEVARPSAPERGSEEAYGLLTVTPPDVLPEPISRDLILLLDTSGSMSGAPLEHARRVLLALLASLRDEDRLEMVEFSNSPRRWKSAPVFATAAHRREAAKWLNGLRASGGTEMASGVMEALRPLRPDSQRQVVLATDGLIGSEQEIVKALLERLPSNCRFHVLGVGSAANRSLTAAAARAGRGVEQFVNLDEDAERAAQRLIARTASPLITELQINGDALIAMAPQRAPDLYAQAPAMLSLALRPEGGTLIVHGKMARGTYRHEVRVSPCALGEGSAALTALYAREAVEDWELRRVATRIHDQADAAIERLGLMFQISTRLTSWVAVSAERTVDPTQPSRQDRVPQMLPYGMSVEGLGLRAAPVAPMAHVTSRALSGKKSPIAAERLRILTRSPAPSGAQPGDAEVAWQTENKREEAPSRADRRQPLAAPATPAAAPTQDELARGKGVDPAKNKGARARRLQGRVRRAKENRIWVEIAWETADNWTLPSRVTFILADGRQVQAQVDSSQSTATAWVEAERVVRLTLELGVPLAELGELAGVLISSAGSGWEVIL